MVDLEPLIARHVAVLGSSGQGISCFTAAVLQQIVKMPKARVVIFEPNGEYQDAFPVDLFTSGVITTTRLGGKDENAYKIRYYVLGRPGLQRLLPPSDKTQRPALTFALNHLNKVKWFDESGGGVGLANDKAP